jgi:hypothetical protein
MSGGTWTSPGVYSGTMHRTRSSPWVGTTYDVSRLSIEPAGTLTLSFSGDSTATMSYRIGATSGAAPIVRQPY